MAKGNRGGKRVNGVSINKVNTMPMVQTNPTQSIKPTSQNKVNANATAKKTKLTKTQISNLSRAKMESLAKDIYIKKAMSQGLSQSEADYRFRSLISSNGKTALIKYIYKNQ